MRERALNCSLLVGRHRFRLCADTRVGGILLLFLKSLVKVFVCWSFLCYNHVDENTLE